MLDAAEKYVASRTLTQADLTWQNSTLLAGEAASSVAELRSSSGPDLTVLGSGDLVRALLGAGLVDELVLSVHPLVLVTGRQLFAAGLPRTGLTLVDSVATTTGVLIARYRRA